MKGKMMRLPILVILCLTVGLGGCAGNTKSTKTQDIVESGSDSQIAELEDGLISEGQENKSEFFDPFDESGPAQVKDYDPLEPVNSAIFEFNYRVDKYVVKPVAQVYNFFIPPDVQQSFSNVFQNIRFVPRLFNNLLQAKFQGAGIELSRFLINSTLGVGGLFDPAKIMFELETPQEDLGQTFGTYGVPPGPFLMIPLLGPFTLRDGIGFIGDTFLDPFNWLVLPIFEIADAPRLIQHDPTISYARLGMSAGETVNLRSLTLEKFQGVEEGTLDLYGAVRNAYLQQRLKAIQE
ncbi:MAG: VacJ family lipoprotein [Nitrospirota bacterium]|nr:VacJ family lipoprotein [Nitrospirota bacterium]